MKKILLIGGLCFASCFCFIGCGTNQQAVLTNLTNQIDLLNNTVNSISSVGEASIPALSSLTKEQSVNYSGIYQSAKENLSKQNSYKTAILAKNGLIKNKIGNEKLSLGDQNSRALIDLTTALSKNTKALNETKSELNRSIGDVKRSISTNPTNSQISAKINRLSNCMDSRDCYYKNLLNTLNNIESILGIEDSSFDYSKINLPIKNNVDSTSSDNISSPIANIETDEETSNTEESTNPTDEEDISKDLERLLYQYLLNNFANNTQNCPNGNCYNNCPNGNCNNNCPNGNCYNNNCPNGTCNNGIANGNANNSACPNGNCPGITAPQTANGGYYGYNGYGFNNGIVNPSRNTDTYRAWGRNIDTYRANPNAGNNLYNGYNNRGIYNNAGYNYANTTPNTTEKENNTDKNLINENNSINESKEKTSDSLQIKESENNLNETTNKEEPNKSLERVVKIEEPKDIEIYRISNKTNDTDQNFAGKTNRAITEGIIITTFGKTSTDTPSKLSKGHTNAVETTNLDINKKIKELIKPDSKNTFSNNENFIILR